MLGRNEPGPTVSLTSRFGLLFQCTNVSHIEWSSAGQLFASFEPPGAVFAVLGAGVPPQATSAPAAQAPTTSDAAAAAQALYEAFTTCLHRTRRWREPTAPRTPPVRRRCCRS